MRAGNVTDINVAFQFEATRLKTLCNVGIYPLLSLIWSVIVVTGEQPPSSMTPVILESKSGGLLVIGGSGGSMITSATALVTHLNWICIHACLLPRLFDCIILSPVFFRSQ